MATFTLKEKLAVAYWQSATVRDQSIWQMLCNLRARLPNVNAIAVKTNTGASWMGVSRPRKQYDMRIEGTGDVRRWAQRCAQMRLSLIAWCVVRGTDPDAEMDVIAQVCSTPGVAAMVLDVERGDPYFQGDAQVAAMMAENIRRRAGQAHIGLCFDPRGAKPKGIFIDAWLPYVDSLHPMVYPETYQRDPVLAVRDAFNALSFTQLPVTMWLGAHSLKDANSLLRAVPTVFEHTPRAEGIVLWRYGDDVMGSKEFSAINRIWIPGLIAAPPPSAPVMLWGKIVDSLTMSTTMRRIIHLGRRSRARVAGR